MDGAPLAPLTLGAGDLDASLPIPLYHQIYLGLKKRIQDGEFAPDTTLPGEKELCQVLGVSRITVKRALGELAAEGYVSRHRGRGTVVRYRVPSPVVRASFDGLIENLTLMGVKTGIEVLSVEEVPADGPVAEALEVGPGTVVQHALRRRLIEDAPFSFLRTYIPLDIAAAFDADRMATTPVLTLLAEAGATPDRARQVITAVAADAGAAGALGLSVGAPVLRVTRTIKQADGRPIQHIVATYRPDRYEYEMKLGRLGTTEGSGA